MLLLSAILSALGKHSPPVCGNNTVSPEATYDNFAHDFRRVLCGPARLLGTWAGRDLRFEHCGGLFTRCGSGRVSQKRPCLVQSCASVSTIATVGALDKRMLFADSSNRSTGTAMALAQPQLRSARSSRCHIQPDGEEDDLEKRRQPRATAPHCGTNRPGNWRPSRNGTKPVKRPTPTKAIPSRTSRIS